MIDMSLLWLAVWDDILGVNSMTPLFRAGFKPRSLPATFLWGDSTVSLSSVRRSHGFSQGELGSGTPTVWPFRKGDFLKREPWYKGDVLQTQPLEKVKCLTDDGWPVSP